jgi:hypothetical protein
MIKCDNCEKEAEYVSAPEFASTAYFCGSCIPWSLINDQRAGLLPRVVQPAVAVEAPVVEPEPVVEEAPVEVAPVEEAPVEAPVSSKKKKVVEEPTDSGAADVSDN